MLGRIIKNLCFSGVLAGLIGLVTGWMFFLTGQKSPIIFYLAVSSAVFAVSFLTAIYFHNRDVHIEPWGLFLGFVTVITLFDLEYIFFSLAFAMAVTVVTIVIIFVYAFIVRKRKIGGGSLNEDK